ncbi:MAG: hypothetical protein DKM22_05145 [Candidatus Melainabacteria bacterium]|nr:MAG: hypothetical protein DKM22_05145 [Candidatus Melainabacteria bacterium]
MSYSVQDRAFLTLSGFQSRYGRSTGNTYVNNYNWSLNQPTVWTPNGGWSSPTYDAMMWDNYQFDKHNWEVDNLNNSIEYLGDSIADLITICNKKSDKTKEYTPTKPETKPSTENTAKYEELQKLIKEQNETITRLNNKLAELEKAGNTTTTKPETKPAGNDFSLEEIEKANNANKTTLQVGDKGDVQKTQEAKGTNNLANIYQKAYRNGEAALTDNEKKLLEDDLNGECTIADLHMTTDGQRRTIQKYNDWARAALETGNYDEVYRSQQRMEYIVGNNSSPLVSDLVKESKTLSAQLYKQWHG